MKVEFLYLQDFGAFHDASFNFDADVRFEYKRRRLKKIFDKKVLPNRFFSSSAADHNVVDLLSAVVGPNGVGKTTLARALREILSGNQNKISFVVVVSGVSPERFDVYYYLGKEKDGRPVELKVDTEIAGGEHWHCACGDVSEWNLDYFVDLVYFSPVYTSQRSFYPDGDHIHDLSTTCRLQTDFEGFLNKEVDNEAQVKQTAAYDFTVTRDALTLVQRFREDRFEVGEHPIRPHGCLVACNHAIAEANLSTYKHKCAEMEESLQTIKGEKWFVQTETRRVKKAIKRYSQAVSILKLNYNCDAVTRMFICFVGCYWRDMGISFAGEKESDEFANLLLAFCSVLLRRMRRISGNKEDVRATHELIVRFFRRVKDHYERHLDSLRRDSYLAHSEMAGSVFQKLIELWDATPEITRALDGILVAGEGVAGSVDEILELAELHAKAMLITSFLVFRCNPPMSTGEMAYLTMWSRLLGYFQQKERGCADKQYGVILFMDEAETALHPLWQRQLIARLILFLERYAPHARIHVILGTHSPMLLSDIPIGDVCFLRQCKKGGTSVIGKDALKIPDTFGANIFDLYHEPFFMEEGTIGGFADAKIRAIMRKISNRGRKDRRRNQRLQDEDLMLVARLVGDEFLREYFDDKLDIGLKDRGEGVAES